MYLWLVAAGLSLIFGVLRVLNFAHGSLYMLGAYFAWVAFRISGSFWVALLVGPALVAVVGGVLEAGFQDSADHRHQRGTDEQRDPEAATDAECDPGEVCAEHVQASVREVEHAQDAEDQREAGGNQPEVH